MLKFWSGLGYYSRARNLHKAAKQIVKGHHGEFPRNIDEAMALSGIGAYTSAAILSIAYGVPPLCSTATWRECWRGWAQYAAICERRATGEQIYARRKTYSRAENAGDWNQALMELGETVCTPQSPRCKACPIRPMVRGLCEGINERDTGAASEARCRAT